MTRISPLQIIGSVTSFSSARAIIISITCFPSTTSERFLLTSSRKKFNRTFFLTFKVAPNRDLSWTSSTGVNIQLICLRISEFFQIEKLRHQSWLLEGECFVRITSESNLNKIFISCIFQGHFERVTEANISILIIPSRNFGRITIKMMTKLVIRRRIALIRVMRMI